MAHNSASLSWAVGKESTVKISGSSNVNSFSFESKEYNGNDTLMISLENRSQRFSFRKGSLKLPVKNFRNSNSMLNRDFRKTLRAEDHPYIIMDFKTISGLNQEAVAEVEITLAGKTVTKRLQLENCQKNNCLNLKGREKMKFSDFGLKPPKNVMGFITVKDELEVEFNLVLKQIK